MAEEHFTSLLHFQQSVGSEREAPKWRPRLW